MRCRTVVPRPAVLFGERPVPLLRPYSALTPHLHTPTGSKRNRPDASHTAPRNENGIRRNDESRCSNEGRSNYLAAFLS